MYVLRDMKCCRCENEIIVYGFTEKNRCGKYKSVVDYGECVYCGKKEILPQENFRDFVSQFCIRK